MNGNDLLFGLHFVDESLVEEAEEKALLRSQSTVRWILPIAASFAVIITAFSLWSNQQTSLPPPPDDNTPPIVNESPSNNKSEYALHFNQADSVVSASLHIEGHFWQALTPDQTAKILPILSEKYQIEGTVNYSHKDGDTSIFNVVTSVQNEENLDIEITLAPNEVLKCYTLDGEPTLSEIEGVTIEAALLVTDANSRGEQNYVYCANFKLDDVAYYVELSGAQDNAKLFTDLIADLVLGDTADLSVLDHPVVPELRNTSLTEPQAYSEPDFGAYLPRVPSGYQFSSAVRFINQVSNRLFASWSKGYDDIQFTISKLTDAEKERVISVQDTALYDMSLYPIPWAESMPRDKHHIIENPIFSSGDLTLDVISKRGYVRNEQGDTNHLNLRFSVLYGDVVVEISTEGVTPEYLFDALSKLPS